MCLASLYLRSVIACRGLSPVPPIPSHTSMGHAPCVYEERIYPGIGSTRLPWGAVPCASARGVERLRLGEGDQGTVVIKGTEVMLAK